MCCCMLLYVLLYVQHLFAICSCMVCEIILYVFCCRFRYVVSVFCLRLSRPVAKGECCKIAHTELQATRRKRRQTYERHGRTIGCTAVAHQKLQLKQTKKQAMPKTLKLRPTLSLAQPVQHTWNSAANLESSQSGGLVELTNKSSQSGLVGKSSQSGTPVWLVSKSSRSGQERGGANQTAGKQIEPTPGQAASRANQAGHRLVGKSGQAGHVGKSSQSGQPIGLVRREKGKKASRAKLANRANRASKSSHPSQFCFDGQAFFMRDAKDLDRPVLNEGEGEMQTHTPKRKANQK